MGLTVLAAVTLAIIEKDVSSFYDQNSELIEKPGLDKTRDVV